MVKKLTKHGISLALIIDWAVLDLLEIHDDTPLDITTDGEVLIVTPVRDEERRAKFDTALRSANTKYGRALKHIAE